MSRGLARGLGPLSQLSDTAKFGSVAHCLSLSIHPSRFVLLVSGLGLGSVSGEALLSTQLLVDVVTGQLGAEGEQSCAAHIIRVILAGNLLSQNTQSRDTINKVRQGGGCSLAVLLGC